MTPAERIQQFDMIRSRYQAEFVAGTLTTDEYHALVETLIRHYIEQAHLEAIARLQGVIRGGDEK